jgi:hypothetical protein
MRGTRLGSFEIVGLVFSGGPPLRPLSGEDAPWLTEAR